MKPINTILRHIVANNPNDADLTLKETNPRVLHSRLKKGVVIFVFLKKDGTLRITQGTLQIDKVPEQYRPLGFKQASPLQINYFDMIKNKWRSLSSNTKIYLG